MITSSPVPGAFYITKQLKMDGKKVNLVQLAVQESYLWVASKWPIPRASDIPISSSF